MPEAIRIVIADDHPLFRDGLRRALGREPGLTIVAEAADGAEALERIRSLRPDVAVLDIGLPAMDGCAVARTLREERVPVEIVFLTVCDEIEFYEQALEWDVKGYLLKDATPDEIVRCVREVAAGRNVASAAMTTYLVQRTVRMDRFTRSVPGLDKLTSRERAILRGIARHKGSKEIAGDLGISPKTVDAHRSSICRKLDLHGNHVLSRFAWLHRDAI